MFSDIGITPSIIQNKRGDDPNFLNTAWTMQVIRGLVLWLITLLGAYPYSIVYDEPLLLWMLPVAGLAAIISGFNSTSLATANRDLKLKKVTLTELISQITSLTVMICWVYIYPTVWALVFGNLVNSLVKLTLSQYWIADTKNKFHWERKAASSLIRFGRWIFLTTALTFFAAQIDRIILGYLIGTASLGIYSIAAMFKETAFKATQMLGSKVLFPSYSKLVRANDPQRFLKALKKSRLLMISATWVATVLLLIFGSRIIETLYDDRYKDAVWMIQLLPLGTLVGILSSTYHNAYLAKGKSSYISILLFYQIVVQTTLITIGYYIYGIQGVIIALSSIGWFLYPANLIASIKLKLWQPVIDIPVIILATIFTVLYVQNTSILS